MICPVTHRARARESGFTLIELMIVVAIIGILAAIAIPNFIRMQLRAKVSEGRINLAAIRDAQESYMAEVGNYEFWASAPLAAGSPPGQFKVAWSFAACSSPPDPADPGYCRLGWAPEGEVYFNYAVDTNTNVSATSSMFFAVAEADLDGDGNLSSFGLNRPDDAGGVMAAGPLGCGDVLNVSTGATLLTQVGPCDEVDMGINVF